MRNSSVTDYNIEVDTDDECARPYVVQPVNFSNMLLIVVNIGTCYDTTVPSLTVVPEEVIYENNSLVCQKAWTFLKRKRPESCIRTHPRESEIKDLCGLASDQGPSNFLIFLLLTCILIRQIVFRCN